MRTSFLVILALLLSPDAPAGAAAPATQPSLRATERAKVLKDQVKSFWLELRYQGKQDKPYYRLILCTPTILNYETGPFDLLVMIPEVQAGKIIDHLAVEGFLDRAEEINNEKHVNLPVPPPPFYELSVRVGVEADRHEFYGIVGWGLPMLKRLDDLRAVLEGDAAKRMDVLLGRLSGHRREWQAASASDLVKKLSDPSNEVRAKAAAALRQVLAADPAAAPNCHDKAYWERRIEPLQAGMPLKDALNILLPDISDEQRQEALEGGGWSGQSGFNIYRLDDYWTVTLQLGDLGHEKLLEKPTPARSVKRVWVEPPADYTGTWVTWHVNGQRAHEIQYANGKYDGTFTAFNDDGGRCYEQHYKQHVCDGTDTGYYRSGKKSYEGLYRGGKQVGTWRWYSEDGKVTSVQEHGDGQQ